jgi:tetratricopeptide (TPR) repeat protein
VRRRPSTWTRAAAALAILVLMAGCAARTVTPAPVTTPRHPDFVFPALPEGSAPEVSELIQRGWQFLQGGDLRNAERDFRSALKQSPQAESPEAALAYLDLARGNADDALGRFDRALSVAPAYVPALIGRGQALMDLQREGEALASFEAAVKADPSLTDLQARVAVLRLSATQDLLARATAAVEAGKWDAARVAYQQAIAASPDSPFLYRDLASVELRDGRPDTAAEQARRAIELDPTDARAYALLGQVLDQQGDAAAALAAYEKARSLDFSSVPPATLEAARERAAVLTLPAEYRAIATSAQVTRAEVAALIGVRLAPLVAQARPRQVVITDVRGHWAQPWIGSVVQAGIMDTQANYTFDPSAVVRRGDLARTVSRVLSLIAALHPERAGQWQNARVEVSDVAPTHLSYPAVSMAAASGVMPLENATFGLLRAVTGAEGTEVIGRLEALAR